MDDFFSCICIQLIPVYRDMHCHGLVRINMRVAIIKVALFVLYMLFRDIHLVRFCPSLHPCHDHRNSTFCPHYVVHVL